MIIQEWQAQIWLEQRFPENRVSNIGVYKGDRREDIGELDISSGGKLKAHFEDKRLVGPLKLAGFTSLHTLKCSSQQLTELDVSECHNLKELNCSINQLTSFNVKSLTELKEINCCGNRIDKLNLSSNTSLERLFCQNNPFLTKIIGLEKLRRSLMIINSKSFKFLNNELGENIDEAKEILNKYKELMETKNRSYQKIDSRTELFNSDERTKSREIKKNYEKQIARIVDLTNKWD